MIMMKKILGLGAGLAAISAAAPAAAQYYQYGYSPYGYSNPYSNPYGYNNYAYGMNTNAAAQQCTAAVQSRLYNRNRVNMGSILGAVLGANTASQARVLSVTRVTPRDDGIIRVRGLATSGRVAYNGYGPYGVGAYGALGYSYQPDLSFKCDVDFRGYVRDVDIYRR